MRMKLVELPRVAETNDIVDAIIYSGKEDEVTRYLSEISLIKDIETEPLIFLKQLHKYKDSLFTMFNLKKIGE